jgi:hypothetical protein
MNKIPVLPRKPKLYLVGRKIQISTKIVVTHEPSIAE